MEIETETNIIYITKVVVACKTVMLACFYVTGMLELTHCRNLYLKVSIVFAALILAGMRL